MAHVLLYLFDMLRNNTAGLMREDPQEPLTMTVKEYARVSGASEYVVRQEITAGRIPHRRFGRRGLIKILRRPALTDLGFEKREPAR
jgi:hypothetical protein